MTYFECRCDMCLEPMSEGEYFNNNGLCRKCR